MLDGFEMMYQVLDRCAQNDMSEIEHAFVHELKWAESYPLTISDEEFWDAMQRCYGIVFTDEDKKSIVTIGDLKGKIADYLITDT